MALTKWDADLIDGLDELDVGEMEGDYLPLEGGTLTGELTVDANLILEGSITKGTLDLDLQEHADSEFTLPLGPDDSEATTWPQFEYILSPSRGKMQHLTVKTSYDGGLSSDVKNSLFVIAPDQSENISEEDQDYFFEDGQSMTIRIEIEAEDLDRHKADRYQCVHRWNEDIWWVNTKDGLAPDLNETGVITVNLWKAKGIVYGQLAGDFVKQPERVYHPNAFDMSKLDKPYKKEYSSIAGSCPATPGDPFVWNPEGGIQNRQGTTFARTSRDGRHFFIGQSGGDGWFDKDYPDNNTLYPGEFRVFGNNIEIKSNLAYSPLPQPLKFHWEGDDHPTKPSTDSKLLGTATDMRLRVDKGTGVDFNPDGTKMFQSVACYHDPSLKDKYKNVIGAHHLAKPWDVGTTDFLQNEELNDIIYCDEKYSEVQALHPDMRVCCLTFRPDGMGFYFAYVVHSLTSQDLEYYFVQQDLEVPWELSSAKDDYKYSDKISHKKCENGTGYDRNPPPHLWQINGMTVSANGRFMHVVYPHNYLKDIYPEYGFALPRQFEMTTPWDISTAGNMHKGVGARNSGPMHPGFSQMEASGHGVHWDESGENCYFSFVQESGPTQDGTYKCTDGLYKQNKFRLK